MMCFTMGHQRPFLTNYTYCYKLSLTCKEIRAHKALVVRARFICTFCVVTDQWYLIFYPVLSGVKNWHGVLEYILQQYK